MKRFYSCISTVFAWLLVTSVSLKAQNVPELIYFKFNSASSGNVANEADATTRVSTNGTLNGISLVSPGQFGSAIAGNGGASASNSTNANWALNLNSSWTISMWISGLTNTATSNYIFGGSGGSTFRAMTGTGLVSGGGNIKVRGTGLTDIDLIGVFDAVGTPVVVHIVYDQSAGQSRVYKNGSLLATLSQSTTVALTGTDFRVGGYATSNGLPSGAKLDEFRMYNRALSATEIANTWNVEINGCATPANLNATAVLGTSASFAWSPVSGSAGYEYAMTTTPTPPSSGSLITGTTRTQSGLSQGTTYYFHVRNKCSSTNYSGWTTKQITTLVCSNIDTVRPGNITDTSAMVTWNNRLSASSYEYIVTTDPTTPASTAVGNPVNGTFAVLGGLQENTTYHFFIRSVCASMSDVSDWTSVSFTTRFSCKPPAVTLTPQQGSVDISWDKVLFAAGYEYVVTKSPAPPSLGTPIFTEQINVPLPNDGSGAYFHIRTKCYDIFTMSQWGTTQLLAPTGISNISAGTGALRIFPNPAKDKLVIEVPGASTEGNISITDISGKVVYSTKAVTGTAEVDMTGYPRGLYMVRYTGSDISQVAKLVKE